MKRTMMLFLPVLFSMVGVSDVFALTRTPPADVLYSSEVFSFLEGISLISDIGLVLPIIVAWFAIRVANLMQGGKFERIWKLIAAGMSILAIVKVVDGLEMLGVLYVGGLRTLLEFVMILVFFSAFITGYRSLQMALRGPILEKPEINIPKEPGGASSSPPEDDEPEPSEEKQDDDEGEKEPKKEKKKKKKAS